MQTSHASSLLSQSQHILLLATKMQQHGCDCFCPGKPIRDLTLEIFHGSLGGGVGTGHRHLHSAQTAVCALTDKAWEGALGRWLLTGNCGSHVPRPQPRASLASGLLYRSQSLRSS